METSLPAISGCCDPARQKETEAVRLAGRAEALIDAGAYAEGLALAGVAICVAPAISAGHAARARALRGLGDADGALAALDALAPADPACAPAHDARAVLLAEAGRLPEARAAYQTALRLDPLFARAHFGLASLGEIEPEQRAKMEALAAQPASLEEPQRVFLLYALAKAYDEAGDIAHAFACAEGGARLRALRWRGDERAALQRLARARRTEAGKVQGDPTEAPIFVFGMPRSGTTLVEQILASHPDVHALGETEGFAQEAVREDDPAKLAAAYLAYWPAQARAARRVVDKTLGNFLHVGATRRAFPNAKLVHVRRDPLDCCLSIFFSLFDDMPFPPDLAGLGRYYRGYAALMASWRGAFHEIAYESLVANFETEARALLAYCGLDWNSRCLSFHETSRPVATASLAQVRRPLYRDAIGRARRYAPFLAPLREALDVRDNAVRE